MSEQTKTPETDANLKVLHPGVQPSTWYVQADFARRLERERDEAREALRWYADEAEAIARHVLAQKTTAVMASMQVLALDAGKRARAVLGEGGGR